MAAQSMTVDKASEALSANEKSLILFIFLFINLFRFNIYIKPSVAELQVSGRTSVLFYKWASNFIFYLANL